ncbi:MAG: CinA family protein [Brevundimonas sp.]
MSETLSASLPNALEVRVMTVLQRLCDRNLTLAAAESCTGGLIASVMTDVEGCSHAFERGFVTYTEAAKTQLLGVPAELIAARTAVSREVAKAMAAGALGASQADVAVSVTGYAGPGGDGAEEGLVYLALADRRARLTAVERHFGPLGRGGVRLRALDAAVGLLETWLDEA